ncbi:MAG: YigZ family protein [Lutimonas sp.]
MDTYKTLKSRITSPVYKVKGSKFMAFAYPVQSNEEVDEILKDLRAEHTKANHCCYAWKMGKEKIQYRHNDDGEPTNSAGKPIYGQILSFELTDVLIAVVRYFGGTKLGVGGLIQAYRESARLALEQGTVIRKEIKLPFWLEFEYPQMDKVMRLIKEKQIEIISQKMDLKVSLGLLVNKRNELAFRESLAQMHEVDLKE